MQEAEDAMRNSGNRHLLNRLAELDAQRAASRGAHRAGGCEEEGR